MNKKDELIAKTKDLYGQAHKIRDCFIDKKSPNIKFEIEYQQWYTESSFVIKQIIPDRLSEFKEQYESKFHCLELGDINFTNYAISDFFHGVTIQQDDVDKFDWREAAAGRFIRQATVLRAALAVLKSSLNDMEGTLQAEMYDNEIVKARDLHGCKFYRAAGVIAGVVLESHLKTVCANNGFEIEKPNPSLSDCNELLKKNKLLDVPNWRWIQRMGDIRNYCAHDKERDPTDDEVLELINGVDKAIKTIF